MKTYTLVSPSVDGLLSDDNLYFEGVSRPQEIYKIRDGGKVSEENVDLLEKYFNDVYNLLLRKLSGFAMFESIKEEDEVKIQALLQELIKVKRILVKGPILKSPKDDNLL
jgi:hypothetical protein